jgi:hypothetical protein
LFFVQYAIGRIARFIYTILIGIFMRLCGLLRFDFELSFWISFDVAFL